LSIKNVICVVAIVSISKLFRLSVNTHGQSLWIQLNF
jgi:hypothetical protein